ncbi:MAG: DUF4783 domain-containing protein [Bacteroidales bacterium]|nr:DUF4783 domain-containing protein [Bacteroidales bacterium]
MYTASRILIVAAALLGMVGGALRAEVSDTRALIENATKAIGSGNADQLAQHFSPTVEIDLLGEENFYSKPQASLLLKNFFAKNHPAEFSIAHEGQKEGTAFVIGSLRTSGDTFRVSIFIKTESSRSYIHQLRVERSGR